VSWEPAVQRARAALREPAPAPESAWDAGIGDDLTENLAQPIARRDAGPQFVLPNDGPKPSFSFRPNLPPTVAAFGLGVMTAIGAILAALLFSGRVSQIVARWGAGR
jgi:hypothetical protein